VKCQLDLLKNWIFLNWNINRVKDRCKGHFTCQALSPFLNVPQLNSYTDLRERGLSRRGSGGSGKGGEGGKSMPGLAL